MNQTPNPMVNNDLQGTAVDQNDYIHMLNVYGTLDIKTIGYYYKVGNNLKIQGWMFHIPIWDIQINSLLSKLVPYLLDSQIPFQIPVNKDIHTSLQAAAFGYKSLGKIICIFPEDNIVLSDLAKDLIEITHGYKGTPVPTDFHLGNIIYTRFGSYNLNNEQNDAIITAGNGVTFPDDEPIPPITYPWAPWPFSLLLAPVYHQREKIIHNKYLIKSVLKPDSKGEVLVALYQKNLISLKKCIIKEAIKGMGVDSSGRDITARLEWQMVLYNKLKDVVPLPKIIDNFEDANSLFIVFEYIKGISFGSYLTGIYNNRSWHELQLKEKEAILTFSILIIEIVKNFHHAGYVHRDLNTENFFLDNKDKVWLLDLELSYDKKNNHPVPPFEKGTEGYMSPEQMQILTPTFEQDIYSIGAILLLAFTHILPENINREDVVQLKNTIKYLNGSDETVEVISACLNDDNSLRPKIEDILSSLKKIKTQLSSNFKTSMNYRVNQTELEEIIHKATYTLTNPNMVNVQDYWSSPISTTETFIGNARLDRTIYLGYRKGVSGVLYTIGKVAAAKGNIHPLKEIIQNNLALIASVIQHEYESLQPGLFTNSYGMAMGLIYLMKSNIITTDEANQNLLKLCLDKIPGNLDLAEGMAGYGITLLKCKGLLLEDYIQERLDICLQAIISNQLPNGAWKFESADHPPIIITSFTHGIAGIIWFLLSYAEETGNKEILSSGLMGLNYLLKISKKDKNTIVWPLVHKFAEMNELSNGGYNLLLPFIKAYKLTQNPIYKKTVEKAFLAYPQHLVIPIYSLERGLAGLGEVYLEAYQAFDNEEWLQRAQWLANSLMLQSIHKDGYCYWINNDPFFPHADLMTGHCGILHFLTRMWRPDLISNIY
jgi:serine/threonine protein kinase